MSTPQANAVQAAQTLANLCSQLIQLDKAMRAWLQDNANNNYDSLWITMPTAVINADGSIAGSNDGSPNGAHPINVPANAPLLMKRNDLVNGVDLLAKFRGFTTWTTGTIATPIQAPLITAALLAPNTI